MTGLKKDRGGVEEDRGGLPEKEAENRSD